LEEGTRLRTACDLKMAGDLRVIEPQGFSVPDKDKILEYVKTRIKACKPLFADPPVTEITTKVVIKEKKQAEEDLE